MEKVAIAEISIGTYDVLKFKYVPTIPVSLINEYVGSPEELLEWKQSFISYYGDTGNLQLVFNRKGQVEGNDQIDKATLELLMKHKPKKRRGHG